MKIVANASPLIFLAKIHKLELLIELFEEVIIPMQVFAEVVTKGKEKGMDDAFLIENLVLRVVQEGYRIKEKILARFLAEIER